MKTTNNLIIEQHEKQTTIYSQQVINHIYNDLAHFANIYNESTASETPTDIIKYNIDMFKAMTSQNNGEWYRAQIESINNSHSTKTKFGNFLNHNSDHKRKQQIEKTGQLLDVFHHAHHIKPYYFTPDIFRFKHENITDQLNPFASDGNKLQIKDKESVSKVIKEHESITLKTDVWERIKDFYNMMNFVDEIGVNDVANDQDSIVSTINAATISAEIYRWTPERILQAIKDAKQAKNDAYRDALNEYAKSVDVESAEKLLENVPPSQDDRIYKGIREQLQPLFNVMEQVHTIGNKYAIGYNRNGTHFGDPSPLIYSDNTLTIDELTNEITINEKEREQALKEFFNVYEFADNDNISEPRKENIENAINQAIGNGHTLNEIWYILSNQELGR